MNVLKTVSAVFGVVFVIIGVLGFVPAVSSSGMLFDYFTVNTVINVAYLVTGIVGLIVATKDYYSKLYFQVFSVIYAVITVVGFVFHGSVFVTQFNMADNVFYLIVAIIALYFGYFYKKVTTV